jgi:hypothetical protein
MTEKDAIAKAVQHYIDGEWAHCAMINDDQQNRDVRQKHF